jgi:hypothetical protein
MRIVLGLPSEMSAPSMCPFEPLFRAGEKSASDVVRQTWFTVAIRNVPLGALTGQKTLEEEERTIHSHEGEC